MTDDCYSDILVYFLQSCSPAVWDMEPKLFFHACSPCSETPHALERESSEPEQWAPDCHMGASVSAGRGAPVSASVPLTVRSESPARVEGECV